MVPVQDVGRSIVLVALDADDELRAIDRPRSGSDMADGNGVGDGADVS